MEFTLNVDPLKDVLKKIKTSKILEKDDESLSAILIEATPEGTLKFIARNDALWSCHEMTEELFSELDGGVGDNWCISDPGKVFINGQAFIDIVNSYPGGVVLKCQLKHSKAKKKGEYLSVKYETPSRKSAATDFISCKVKYFEENPPKEEVTKITVPASRFVEAVQSVSFATQIQTLDEGEQHLFGCRVEVYDSDILCTTATNKKRICCYGENGKDKPKHTFDPTANMLEPILANLKKTSDVEIHYGKKNTLIKQGGQQYSIPNVIETEKIPDCRKIMKVKEKGQTVKIKVDKKEMKRCLKAISLTAGKQYGMRLVLDTEDKSMSFSAQKIDDGGMIRTVHEEVEPLGDAEIKLLEGEHLKDSILVNIEFFRDILERFPSDYIWICFGDEDTILFEDENANFKYLLCLLEETR